MKKECNCSSLHPSREKVAAGRMRGAVTGQPLPDTQGAVVGQALPDNAPQGHLLCSLRPLREKVAEGRMRGFTLIELLVVVMIIAILAAIAVPQYKHAVLKSRFSTVMPMAKSIADAQEVYYQGRQLYALDVDELDVTPVNAENTSVSLSQTDGYDYVMAQNSRVPGANYIIYQKYSENYPSEIHCEAADDDEDAQWLCGVLSNNNSIGQTITSGYTTYLINGTGAGIAAGAGNDTTNESGQTVASCDSAEAMGYTCNITTNEAGKQEKHICTEFGVCRTKTYNEDGSYTSVTCKSSGSNGEGICTSNWQSVTYDANGNKLAERQCSSVDSSGNCTAYSSGINYAYDANGNQLRTWNCSSMDSSGNCTAYSSGTNYTYDANGNNLTIRNCSSVDSSGNCTEYGPSTNYTYDANGNKLTERRCSSVDSNGNCTAYNAGMSYDYTYDANGNLLIERDCSSVNSNGKCTYSYGVNYTYDTNGNQLTQRRCGSLTADGHCASYVASGRTVDMTYDENGNRLTRRTCSSVNSSGTCTAYDASMSYDWTYDANGNMTSQRSCSTVASNGTCSQYRIAMDFVYDEDGKLIAIQSCSGSNLNTATGECTAYDSTTVRNN